MLNVPELQFLRNWNLATSNSPSSRLTTSAWPSLPSTATASAKEPPYRGSALIARNAKPIHVRMLSRQFGCDTAVSVPGEFKLDQLHIVKLNLLKKISTILIFLHITPERGREEAAGAGNEKMGFTQKWIRYRGFSTWGIQTGPFAACSANFVHRIFHHPALYTGGSHFLLSQREEERKQQGLEMRK